MEKYLCVVLTIANSEIQKSNQQSEDKSSNKYTIQICNCKCKSHRLTIADEGMATSVAIANPLGVWTHLYVI